MSRDDSFPPLRDSVYIAARAIIQCMHKVKGYSLLDSGEGRKLERFGSVTVSRPSSLCEWRRRAEASIWEKASARLEFSSASSRGASDRSSRWEFSEESFSTWTAEIESVTMELELMSNGQLGIFPEHALYLADLLGEITRLKAALGRQSLKVLNLFAYTGLATCFCARQPGVSVTHVDLAKRAIESAKRNLGLNKIPSDAVRWIVDDALTFMARENRKGVHYDIVIIDPPSFSRVSKTNSWTLDEKVAEIVRLVLGVLAPTAGAVFFTNHSSGSTVDIARNIALDAFAPDGIDIALKSLSLEEEHSDRRLPAGSLIVIRSGIGAMKRAVRS